MLVSSLKIKFSMSCCEEYSDNDPCSSDEGDYEYEIPLCFCGKEAKLRISGTEKNDGRPFFNCAKRKFNKQCGFFVWEDELFSDESGDESSFVCDECLEKERDIDEIESARDDDCKASWDSEKQRLIGKVKDEPSDQDGLTIDTPSIVKVKDEPFDQDGLAKATTLTVKVKDEPLNQDDPTNDSPLTVKVKDEPLDQGGPVNDAPLTFKVKDEPMDQGGPAKDAPLTVKVKDEPSNQGGPANDVPLIDKVKDEPLDQDGSQSCDKAESVCVKCLTLKRRVVEIKIGRDENKVSWDRKKVEVLTKLQTAESEYCQIKKETKEADDKPLLEKLSDVESELGQISKNTKHASEVDHILSLDKLPKPENETVESELHHIRKKTKLGNEGDVTRFEMLSNLEKETAVSEMVLIRKKTEVANEGDDVQPFEKLSDSEETVKS